METYARRVFAGDGNTLKDDGEIGGSGGGSSFKGGDSVRCRAIAQFDRIQRRVLAAGRRHQRLVHASPVRVPVIAVQGASDA